MLFKKKKIKQCWNTDTKINVSEWAGYFHILKLVREEGARRKKKALKSQPCSKSRTKRICSMEDKSERSPKQKRNKYGKEGFQSFPFEGQK